MKMLYEGKAKRVFLTDKENEYVVYFKDDATAFNGEKKEEIGEKGIINNKISSYIFEILNNSGVKTHYIKNLSDREMLVKKVDIVLLEVIVRNISAGSICKRLGFEEGIVFDAPIVEFSYKDDALGDPLVNDEHAIALKVATREEIEHLKAEALKINTILIDIFKKMNLKLVDFKIEFGRCEEGIILADEISPDTCRLWDVNTNEKLDKDRFRKNLGNVIEGYKEVLSRIN